MIDETESVRREMAGRINAVPAERQRLEETHGRVWTTDELQADFEVIAFASPLIVVREKATGRKGSLFFQHRPRFYWGFQPD